MGQAKQILIIGRHAALTHDMAALIWPRNLGVQFMDGPELGLLDIARLRRNIEALAPALIISLVGTQPNERAEYDRTLTQARNHWAVGDLAEVAGQFDIPLVHLSSDQVFAGDRAGAYRETDTADAVSLFGQTQAAGEAEIRAHCRRHVILRTGWLFGANGHNMLRTTLSLGRRGGRVHVPHDHVSGPTPVRELCAALRRIALQILDSPVETFGGHTVHFCAAPAATLYEFAHAAIARAAAYQVAAELVPITPNRFGVVGAAARRTELDCSLAESVFGLNQPDWHQALADCVDEICQSENVATEEQIAALAEVAQPRHVKPWLGALPHGIFHERRRAS